jgi:hypothetical protein
VFKGEMKGLRDDEKGADKAPRTDVRTDKVEENRPVSRPETPGSTAP